MRARAKAIAFALVLLTAIVWSAVRGDRVGASRVEFANEGTRSPAFDEGFWRHWGDGRAELSSYDLTFPRYGEPRRGTAVTIFVTETFSQSARVKADPGVHPRSDEIPVMKLNLVQDFPTGIYDYNLLTSAFAALAPWKNGPAGSMVKVTFSAQEWCGHVFHELLPGGGFVRSVSHSYFDREGDRSARLDVPRDAIFEDALFFWARGLAGPNVAPGDTLEARLLRSSELARLRHVPIALDPVVLAREAATDSVTAPAGVFDARACVAEIGGDLPRRWIFRVEVAWPHRIVSWETSHGKRAELVASERLVYWEMNGSEFTPELSRLGLSPRPARTP